MEHETTSFDPRTWVSPEPISVPKEETPAPEPEASGIKPAWVAIPAVALVVIGAGTYFLWGGSSEAADEAAAEPRAVASKAAAPIAPAPASVRIIQVAGFAELGSSLEAMGLPVDRANEIAREAIAALGTEEEMRVSVELIGDGKKRNVRAITAELASGSTIMLTRQSDGTFKREDMLAGYDKRVRTASGTINQNTFYASAVEAGVPDSLITEFAKAFSFDFDFQRDVQLGDKFSATWEETVSESGRTLAPPRLLYVELESAGKSRRYYAFTPPEESEQRWFDENGNGAARGLMRTPVDGARITSKYGYRTHPISRRQKKHNGVDFAAPTGTPIYASGDAVVIHRRYSGGAGNLIKLDHGEGMQTWYMHLNDFADDLVLNEPVRQGQIIGYVGSTGASTGPHLHYEIRLNLEPTDPLTFETSETEALAGASLTMFRTERERTKSGMGKTR